MALKLQLNNYWKIIEVCTEVAKLILNTKYDRALKSKSKGDSDELSHAQWFEFLQIFIANLNFNF